MLSKEIFIIFDFTNKPKLATHYCGAPSLFVCRMKILFIRSIHYMIQTSIKIDQDRYLITPSYIIANNISDIIASYHLDI